MAERMTLRAKTPAPTPPKKAGEVVGGLSLPTERKGVPDGIGEYSLFIYGHQKIGKTSFTTQFDKALHFFFEPSGTDYEIFAVEPANWKQFKDYLILLERAKAAGTLEFKTFILDVVDLAYDMCLAHCCGLQGLTYPPTNDFGKTWKEIKTEFRDTMLRLARLGGVVCLSHAKEATIELRDGGEYTIYQPSCAKGVSEVLSKWADLTGYYRPNTTGGRELCITPTSEYEAGNRMERRFKFTDGSQIERIDMGSSAVEGFANFMRAFRNELDRPKVEAEEATQVSDKSPVTKKTSIKLGKKR